MSPSILAAADPHAVAVPALRQDRVTQAWVAVATVSWFGDAVLGVALAWTAVRLLSPGAAGLVVGIQTLPQAALMLAGGVIADRFDTRRVMVAGDLSRAAVLLAASVAWATGPHGASVLVVVGLLFGVTAGLTNPARATLARQLVRPEDLVTVGGWVQLGGRLARLAGAPAGALLVATGGLGPAMLLDAATFAGVAAVLATVVRPRFPIPKTTGQPWLGGVREGLSYLRRTPDARWLTAGLSSLNVLVTPAIGIGVALRVGRSGWSPTWVGIAEGCLAIGAILGSLLAIRRRRRRLAGKAFWLLAVQGLAITVVGAPSRVCLAVAMLTIGLTSGTASVWLSGVFQQTIAATHLGRVSSVSQLGDLSLTPLALPVFGLVVGSAGILPATTACGLAMAGLCLFFARRPAIRALP